VSYRFNPPPGWPVPSTDWRPPDGWQPDPWWPPPPSGWQFWVVDAGSSTTSTHAPTAVADEPVPPYPITASLPTFEPPAVLGHPLRTPARRRSIRLWLVVGGTAFAAVLGLVITAVVVVANAGPNLADAQRECRTAFGKEFDERISGTSGTGVLATVTSIELEEARTINDGFEVNGVVHYDLTAALVPTVHGSVSLTCEAREHDGRLVTTVRNRN
jgi:hypothetical protein